jgi:outer membrane protein OmpA-like peptidoglycan-associated protein
VKPDEPETPAVTESPAEPETPSEPDTPAATEIPVKPEVPASPESSVNTETPAQSGTASEPKTQVEPSVRNDLSLKQAFAELPNLRILFESQSNILTPESLDTLDKIAGILIRFPDSNVAIEGHTDSTGTNEENLQLSLLRATTVRDYLIEKGVSVYNLRALGFGEEVPIANNQTAEGRAINRRIEFTF